MTMVIGTAFNTSHAVTAPGYTIASILANQFNNADTDAEDTRWCTRPSCCW